MTDFTGPDQHLPPLFISSISPFTGTAAGLNAAGASYSIAGGTWPTGDLAIYVPLTLPFAYQVKRFFVVNGANVTNNVDIGIYSRAGTKLYSTGSTAGAGANTTQFIAVSPTLLLEPGGYYLAMAMNGTSSAPARITFLTVVVLRMSGVLQEASAFALPAVMTPASVANAYMPVFGITSTASGF